MSFNEMLYNAIAPKSFADIIGHSDVINTLTRCLENDNVPHSILFTGGSGLGKTTLGRCLAHELKADVAEYNTADTRGIESIRGLIAQTSSMLFSEAKVYLLDECHMLTTEAQNCLLKILEQPPSGNYFILCTTEPNKLLSTIRGRCQEFSLKPLSDKEALKLYMRGCKFKNYEFETDIAKRICSFSENKPRALLTTLERYISSVDKEKFLSDLKNTSTELEDNPSVVIDLVKTILLFNKSTSFSDVQPLLTQIKQDKIPIEQVRRALLAYGSAIAMNSKNFNYTKNITYLMECFMEDYYYSPFGVLVINVVQAFTRIDEIKSLSN